MSDWKVHLAATVLNDRETVSYRLLARQLQLHGSTAKRILFAFHQDQNKKRPGSVHATYIVNGIVKTVPEASSSQSNGTTQDADGDTAMPSSPPPSSSMPYGASQQTEPIGIRTLMLVRESDLSVAVTKFEDGYSMHIYSISPSPIQNLQTLSECNRLVAKNFNSEDPLIANKRYGVIQNPNVRRRNGRRPAGSIVHASTTAAPAKTQAAPVSTKSVGGPVTSKRDDPVVKQVKQEQKKDSTTATKSTTSNTANSRRTSGKQASTLMASFSRSKSNASDKTTVRTETSQPPKEDSKASEPGMMDNDEADEDDESGKTPADTEEQERKTQAARAEKAARAEALRRMMDDDDDDDDDAGANSVPDQTHKDQGDSQGDDRATTEPDKADIEMKTEEAGSKSLPEADNSAINAKPETKLAEPQSIPPPVRRRGRRKVMKKRTVKDEEGYLVTREEAAWESFSEEDKESTNKTKPVTTNGPTGPNVSAAPKKSGGGGNAGKKTGQGSIASFFGKKS